jgi:type III secretion protein U
VSGDKTERPTPKRIKDARKKGQVASSKEVVSAVLMLGFFGLLIAMMPAMIDRFRAMVLMPVPLMAKDFSAAADELLQGYASAMAAILAPFLLLAVVGTIAACVLQFGLLLSGEAIKPSLKKFNPAEYIKKTFGLQNVVELAKSLIKITVFSIVILFVLRDGMQAIVRSPACGLGCMRELTGTLLTTMLLWIAGPLIVVAAADLGYQRWSFTNKNKMSKDEVKREYKETEGDPMIKGARKQLHQQLLMEGNVDRSRKATVLVTNPTHIAVAVYYKEEETPLPIITATGTDLVATRMMEAATAAGVPVMQNVPLAHALLEDGIVDEYIPSELIEPFAEVLRALRDLVDASSSP